MPFGVPEIVRLCAPAALVLPVTAALADAPRALYNKTIELSWSEYRVQRADAGDTTRNSTASVLQVYVSESGRLFTRLSRNNGKRSNNTDSDPEGGTQRSGQGASNLTTSFEGRQLLIENQMQSGARRVQATFADGFASCSLQVRFGKEGSADIRHRGMDGRMYTIISTDVSAARCAIRNGNAFAGS